MVHIKTPQVALPQLWWNCFNTNQVWMHTMIYIYITLVIKIWELLNQIKTWSNRFIEFGESLVHVMHDLL